MKRNGKKASGREALKRRWAIRIRLEKNYSENSAVWMAGRLESLLDYMQYGQAAVAYRRQNGEFRLVRATLLPYEHAFGRQYDLRRVKGAVVYWDLERQAWDSFLLENFLEWKGHRHFLLSHIITDWPYDSSRHAWAIGYDAAGNVVTEFEIQEGTHSYFG